jgi:hypothetical protein
MLLICANKNYQIIFQSLKSQNPASQIEKMGQLIMGSLRGFEG